jgi:heterodisulfide reductase subunit C
VKAVRRFQVLIIGGGINGVRSPARLAAQTCLVCGLCSAGCARVGGRPALDPRDAVLAAARLEIDAVRFGLGEAAGACEGCCACEALCPAGISIARVPDWLATLGAALPALARTPRIG